MSILPRFVVFQSTGKYLSVTENRPASLPSGFVKFDATNIWNPRVKFAVEPAKTGDGQLVHIRSCYNNKYLVAEKLFNSYWLVASGKNKEEDQSKPSCTLFKPESPSGETAKVALYHIHRRIKAIHWVSGINNCVPFPDTCHGLMMYPLEIPSLSQPAEQPYTVSEDQVTPEVVESVFNVIDWETLVILPTQVAFKDENGRYLCTIDNTQNFKSGLDVGDPRVAKELFPTPDGNYRIRDLYSNKFFRLNDFYIVADAEENNIPIHITFSFVKVSDNVVALRSLRSNKFCGASPRRNDDLLITADYPTISKETRLIVEERVLEREVSDIKYRVSDSMIYNKTIEEVSHSFVTKHSSENDSSITLNHSISDSKTSHWTNSLSVKVDADVKLHITEIPFIEQTDVEVKAHVGYEHVWDEIITKNSTSKSTYVVKVPPLSTVKITLMCTKESCKVPYSYTQRDLLTTGERVRTVRDDGIYTGNNSYDFNFESSVVPRDVSGRLM